MSNPPNRTPPQWIRKFLEVFLNAKVLEACLGDLEEKFHINLRNSKPYWKANILYIMEGLEFIKMTRRKNTTNENLNHFDMFRSYLKIGWRNLLRYKVYSIINISGLSLGLACAMLILLYTKDELSFDAFHENANSIYQVTVDVRFADGSSMEKMGMSSLLLGPYLKSNLPEVQSYLRLAKGVLDVKLGEAVQSQAVMFADSNFFSLLTFP